MDAVLDFSLTLRGSATTGSATDERLDKSYQSLLSSLTKHVSQDLTLTAAQADKALVFGEVANAKLMYIKSDRDLSIKLNGAAAAVQIGKCFLVFGDGDISSASVTNTDASNAAAVLYVLAE